MAVPRRSLAMLRKLANQVGATTDDTVRALAARWVAEWDRLSPAWQQAVAAIIDDYQRTGAWPAPLRIARIEAVARAQDQTAQTLALLVAEASGKTRVAAARMSALTTREEPGVIVAQQPRHPVLPAAAAVVAAALTARQTRIAALHQPLARTAAGAISVGIRRQPALTDPTFIQRDLYNRTRDGFDSALIRASTIARTELVDTYRTTAGLVHRANARSLTGWAWACECDLRSCPACWVMHGQTFPLDVPGPEGHGGCRCTRLPLAVGSSLPTAEARFRRLSGRDQITVLGPARWELWRTGQASWADLAVRRTNRSWRDTHVPRPVADLRRLAGIR